VKRRVWFIAGMLVSVAVLAFIFHHIDIREVWAALRTANPWYIAAAFGLQFPLILVRSWRWRLFIPEYRRHGVGMFFEATNVGLMFNNVLPFRAGDFIQAYLIARKAGVARTLVFSTVMMERFIDLFPPIIIIVLGSLFIVLPAQVSIGLALLVLGGLVGGMALMLRLKGRLLPLLQRWACGRRSRERVCNTIAGFYQGIDNFRNPRLVAAVIPLTALMWTGYSAGAYLGSRAMGVALPSFWAAFLIQAITSLSVIIPSSPGYVGTWEGMCVLAMSVFRVSEARALAFALVFHLLGMLPVSLVGAWFVMREFALIRSIRREQQEEASRETPTSAA